MRAAEALRGSGRRRAILGAPRRGLPAPALRGQRRDRARRPGSSSLVEPPRELARGPPAAPRDAARHRGDAPRPAAPGDDAPRRRPLRHRHHRDLGLLHAAQRQGDSVRSTASTSPSYQAPRRWGRTSDRSRLPRRRGSIVLASCPRRSSPAPLTELAADPPDAARVGGVGLLHSLPPQHLNRTSPRIGGRPSSPSPRCSGASCSSWSAPASAGSPTTSRTGPRSARSRRIFLLLAAAAGLLHRRARRDPRNPLNPPAGCGTTSGLLPTESPRATRLPRPRRRPRPRDLDHVRRADRDPGAAAAPRATSPTTTS